MPLLYNFQIGDIFHYEGAPAYGIILSLPDHKGRCKVFWFDLLEIQEYFYMDGPIKVV